MAGMLEEAIRPSLRPSFRNSAIRPSLRPSLLNNLLFVFAAIRRTLRPGIRFRPSLLRLPSLMIRTARSMAGLLEEAGLVLVVHMARNM